jgi:hypothetical protein
MFAVHIDTLEYLNRTVATFPDRTAVRDERGSFTFGEFQRAALEMAATLKMPLYYRSIPRISVRCSEHLCPIVSRQVFQHPG